MNNIKSILTLIFALNLVFDLLAQCDASSIFSNMTSNAVCFEVNGALRYLYSNGLPDHTTGNFPNAGNPNAISAQQNSFTVCAFPEIADQVTTVAVAGSGMGSCVAYIFGMGINGLLFDPWAAEFFTNPNTGEQNRDWNEEATSEFVRLGLDENNAHVQPSGQYHYHGLPNGLIDNLSIDGNSHSPLVGYAADGFPIYYRYVYEDAMDATSSIRVAEGCYQVKDGQRSGNGITAPNGAYDGTYTADYEYVGGFDCILDECNGRFGVTPDYPEGSYYYVMTESYPFIPRCMKGRPDNGFTVGPQNFGCGVSDASSFCSFSTSSRAIEDLSDRLKLFPVPVVDILNYSYSGTSDVFEEVHVLDQMGRWALSLNPQANSVSLEGLPAGVFYLQVKMDGTVITKKFLKE